MKVKLTHPTSGNTLVALLFFMVIAMTITSSSVVVVLVNSLGSTYWQESTRAQSIAEAGAENAILRVLRDPNYAGETFTLDGGTVTITVTGSSTKTISSTGVLGNYRRTIQVVLSNATGSYTVSSWTEI